METSQPSAKRKRLSHACSRCRAKKIRCDEQEPKCTNCVRANVSCVTYDPRTLASAQRREAQRQPAASPTASNYARPASSDWNDAAHSTTSPQDSLNIHASEPSPAESSPLLPVLPRFLNGNSLSVLTQWLDLAFARLGMSHRLHRTYNEIRVREQRPMYTHTDASDIRTRLPTYSEAKAAVPASLTQVFPILELVLLDPSLATGGNPEQNNLSGISPPNGMLDAIEMASPIPDGPTPLHALLHAMSCAMSTLNNDRQSSERCFAYAFGQLPALLEASQALDSLRALVLMSLYLRWRDDIEKAWQILSLAVAFVQNHGMHRECRTSLPGCQELFWCVFVLDKLLSIELERRPMLSSAECNRSVPPALPGPGGAIFQAIVEFSKLQDQILDRLMLSRRAEEDAHESQDPIRLKRLIRDKLHLVAELDRDLLKFADSLPHGLKPTEYLYADADCLPGVTFLAVQYYQAVLLVSRNALLINMQAAQTEIARCFEGQSTTNRLKSGMHVCANAARSILNVLNHAEEMGVRSPLLTPYAPLMAMYALTIHIVRRQSPATARVDLELQATAMSLIKKYNLLQWSSDEDRNKHSGLIQMLERLHHFTDSYVLRSTESRPAVNNAFASTNDLTPIVNIEQWRPGDSSTRVMSPPQSPAIHDANGHVVPRLQTASAAEEANSVLGYQNMAVPMSDFNDDWFLDMGQDAMNMNWDELAMTLGLPTGQG